MCALMYNAGMYSKMSEIQHRLNAFDDFAKTIENKRIALYGIGVNAREILARYPQLHIVGVMDEKTSKQYVYGKKVLREEEVLALRVEVIVVASQIAPLQEIFYRISAFCNANRIGLYDMYGDDLFELFYRLVENQSTLCVRTKEVLKETVDEYDIVSFDLLGTTLSAGIGFKDRIWWEVADKNRDIIANPLDFVEFRTRLENGFPRERYEYDLEKIYSAYTVGTSISDEQLKELINCEKECTVKSFILSPQITEILIHLKSRKKQVFLIADSFFSAKEIEEILENMHIGGLGKVISSFDMACGKVDGLYHMLALEGKKWLHIGENDITDGLSVLINGGDIFLLKKEDNLSESSDYYDIFRQIRKWYDEGKTREIYNYGSNSLYETICRMELLDPFIYCNDENNREGAVANLKKLQFDDPEQPLVSIVIPVYNQFAFTYNCLSSILENTKGIPYEIIVADDHSGDMTVALPKIVCGIHVIRNNKNMRFLKNCNNAAAYARGKYILFLNNDTYVLPGWLKELLSIAENDENVGMVGSKLIYPDGRLQEAGGIVWSDASAWNFGYGQMSGAPVYNYVKEADYISGASIMIRRDLWEEIGGFDEHFAPAYYEDTDLAFEVRKHGHKVIYTPFSQVVHFEGISNGKDTDTGLKAYQVANREKLLKKWKKVLESDHFDNGSSLFVAKDRSRGKKHILVVDHYIPQYDHDAGGRCTYMYLKAFIAMGMQVTFIGDNFAYTMPYAQELLKMGVEILYGNYNKLHIEEWLKNNLIYFDFVYLQRPHISVKYIDIVKKYSDAKVFYFAHDLHHLRLERQYQITGDSEALRESQKWKKVETELFEKADIGHVVGDYEQKHMQEIMPWKPIRNIPLYIFDALYSKPSKPFEERKDILYVGGFGHPPNVDAVMWFAREVFPGILSKMPDIKWHIVGNKPTEEIQALACDNIIVEGFVSDAKLEQLYGTCRLAVVPLRVGAGVKGKIIEAAYYQMPVVTTDIGAEGISQEERALVVENDPKKMVDTICELYHDCESLREYAVRERALIENHYMLKNAIEVLKTDMEI